MCGRDVCGRDATSGTIIIVVTHLGGVDSGRIDCLCGGVLNLFLDRSVVSRNVYGGTADTNLSWRLLGEARSCVNCEVGLGLLMEVCLGLREARSCVNGEVGLGLREAGRSINGEVGFFLVFGLELLTVSTFGQIKLGVVVTARRKVDANV